MLEIIDLIMYKYKMISHNSHNKEVWSMTLKMIQSFSYNLLVLVRECNKHNKSFELELIMNLNQLELTSSKKQH